MHQVAFLLGKGLKGEEGGGGEKELSKVEEEEEKEKKGVAGLVGEASAPGGAQCPPHNNYIHTIVKIK